MSSCGRLESSGWPSLFMVFLACLRVLPPLVWSWVSSPGSSVLVILGCHLSFLLALCLSWWFWLCAFPSRPGAGLFLRPLSLVGSSWCLRPSPWLGSCLLLWLVPSRPLPVAWCSSPSARLSSRVFLGSSMVLGFLLVASYGGVLVLVIVWSWSPLWLVLWCPWSAPL